MKKFTFDQYPEGVHTFVDGYDQIVVIDGLAEVDEKNQGQMKLVAKHGGVEEKPKPKKSEETDKKRGD